MPPKTQTETKQKFLDELNSDLLSYYNGSSSVNLKTSIIQRILKPTTKDAQPILPINIIRNPKFIKEQASLADKMYLLDKKYDNNLQAEFAPAWQALERILAKIPYYTAPKLCTFGQLEGRVCIENALQGLKHLYNIQLAALKSMLGVIVDIPVSPSQVNIELDEAERIEKPTARNANAAQRAAEEQAAANAAQRAVEEQAAANANAAALAEQEAKQKAADAQQNKINASKNQSTQGSTQENTEKEQCLMVEQLHATLIEHRADIVPILQDFKSELQSVLDRFNTGTNKFLAKNAFTNHKPRLVMGSCPSYETLYKEIDNILEIRLSQKHTPELAIWIASDVALECFKYGHPHTGTYYINDDLNKQWAEEKFNMFMDIAIKIYSEQLATKLHTTLMKDTSVENVNNMLDLKSTIRPTDYRIWYYKSKLKNFKMKLENKRNQIKEQHLQGNSYELPCDQLTIDDMIEKKETEQDKFRSCLEGFARSHIAIYMHYATKNMTLKDATDNFLEKTFKLLLQTHNAGTTSKLLYMTKHFNMVFEYVKGYQSKDANPKTLNGMYLAIAELIGLDWTELLLSDTEYANNNNSLNSMGLFVQFNIKGFLWSLLKKLPEHTKEPFKSFILFINKHQDYMYSEDDHAAFPQLFTEKDKLHNSSQKDVGDIQWDGRTQSFSQFLASFKTQFSTSMGGKSTIKDKVHVLGRDRKVYKYGRTQYVKYNKELISMKDARKIEAMIKKQKSKSK